MDKLPLVLAILAIVATLGTVGIVSLISLATEAYAASCNQQAALCHGCAIGSQGATASKSKCVHTG